MTNRSRDKPVAAGSVRFVANHIAAVLRDRRFVGLAELNEAIFDLVAEINARPFQKREDSRRIVFERDERPLLTPLPPARFELADLRKGKVAANYYLQIDGSPFKDAVAGDQLKIESESGRGDPPIGFVDLVSQSVAGPTGPSSKLGAAFDESLVVLDHVEISQGARPPGVSGEDRGSS